MKRLSKYIIFETLKIFMLCIVCFLFLYLIIDFFQKIDNFLEADVSSGVIFSYFFYKAPFITTQMVPPAAMISVVIALSLMKKRSEVDALKACGINLFSVYQPIIMTSLGIGLVVFLVSEIVVPYTSSKCNLIWNTEVEKHDRDQFYRRNHIFYRGPNSIYWIRSFDKQKNTLDNLAFYFFDNSFRLIKRIDARKGVWEKGKWKIMDGIIQEWKRKGDYDVKKFKKMEVKLAHKPDSFVRVTRKPEEMGFWQLKRYAVRVRQEGYDNTKYLVDMHLKMSFPLISFILAFIGIPLSLGIQKGGIPLAVTLGIGGCFLYLFILGLFRSIGLTGVLPPFLSAWVANFVFLFTGLYLTMHVKR
ncbi:LPS export ABC transporter permease LptG [Thermodesulfobacteriota bacterium]